MAGFFLSRNGDVQLGYDGDTCLLRFDPSGDLSQGATWALNDFNPSPAPEFLSSDIARSDQFGVAQSIDSVTVRRYEFSVFVTAPTNTLMRTKLDVIQRTIAPRSDILEQELSFQVYDAKFLVFGKYRDWGFTDVSTIGRRAVKLTIRFVATDPLIYDLAESTFSVPISNRTSTRPFTWPMDLSDHLNGPSAIFSSTSVSLPRWRWEFTNATSPNFPAANLALVNISDNLILGLGNSNSVPWLDNAPSFYRFDPATRLVMRGTTAPNATINNTASTTIGSTWIMLRSGARFTTSVLGDGILRTIPGSGFTSQIIYRRSHWTIGL